jgi:tetratricopeptide (TPR) repeat protein
MISLAQWGAVDPSLAGFAAAASALNSLPHSSHFHESGIQTLLASSSLQNLLNGLGAGPREELEQGREKTASLSYFPAFRVVAEVIGKGEIETAKDLIRGVIVAGGLGDLLMALDFIYGEVPEKNYREGVKALRRIEKGLVKFLGNGIETEHQFIFSPRARERYLKLREQGRQAFDVSAILSAFLATEYPSTVFPPDKRPKILTDYLRKKPGKLVDDGGCFSHTALFAHLGILQGMSYGVVNLLRHVSVYQPEIGLAVDQAGLPFIMTLEDWHSIGAGDPKHSVDVIDHLVGSVFLQYGTPTSGRPIAFQRWSMQRTIDLCPQIPFPYLALAQLTEVSQEALRLCDRSDQWHSNNMWSHIVRGGILIKMGEKEKGIVELKTGLQMTAQFYSVLQRDFPIMTTDSLPSPSELEPWVLFVGDSLLREGKYQEVIDLLDPFITMNLGSSQMLLMVGDAACSLEQDELAQRCYTAYLKTNPPADYSLATCYFNLAQIAWNDRRDEETFDFLDQAVATHAMGRDLLLQFIGKIQEPEDLTLATNRFRHLFEGQG